MSSPLIDQLTYVAMRDETDAMACSNIEHKAGALVGKIGHNQTRIAFAAFLGVDLRSTQVVAPIPQQGAGTGTCGLYALAFLRAAILHVEIEQEVDVDSLSAAVRDACVTPNSDRAFVGFMVGEVNRAIDVIENAIMLMLGLPPAVATR
jgi:hypothetical protein